MYTVFGRNAADCMWLVRHSKKIIPSTFTLLILDVFYSIRRLCPRRHYFAREKGRSGWDRFHPKNTEVNPFIRVKVKSAIEVKKDVKKRIKVARAEIHLQDGALPGRRSRHGEAALGSGRRTEKRKLWLKNVRERYTNILIQKYLTRDALHGLALSPTALYLWIVFHKSLYPHLLNK